MKLLDNKGRVFGVINIIDLFVLAFLIGMVSILIFGWKISKLPQKKHATLKHYYLWDRYANQMQSIEEGYKGSKGYVEFSREYPEYFAKRYELLEQ